jgi:phosphoglucomutase
MLEKMTKDSIQIPNLAGEKIQTILTHAPGDGKAIGGVKVIAENGWFAARPSGTEEIYKIYAESFRDQQHLEQIEADAQTIVGQAFTTAASGNQRVEAKH